MTEKVPFMLLPTDITKALSKKLVGLGDRLSRKFPTVNQVKQTDLKMSAAEYMAATLVNAGFMGVLMFALILFIMYAQQRPLSQMIVLPLAIGLGVFVMFFILLVRYPDVLAGKKAERVDRNLVFALKDMLLQVGSGVSLYNTMINVAQSGYGDTSREFKKLVEEVNAGKPMVNALEELAIDTKSEYLKRTVWQLVNGIKAGSNLKGILRSIIRDLTTEKRTKIRNYAKELNLWSLLYMLFAVAVPSIGTTLLVILTSFAGFGISKGMFIGFIVICFFVQYALIGFVKSRRPTTEF